MSFNPSPSGVITVKFGAHTVSFEGGLTVRTIRDRLSRMVQIGNDAKAHVNGVQLSEDDVVADSNTVTFIRPTGNKG